MFVIAVPDAIADSFTQYGRKITRRAVGWVAKRDKKNDWFLSPAIKYAHKWGKRERAESMALIVGTFLPFALGRMEVIEVERVSAGSWRRVKS